ncbi:hypothetical protein B0H14DRAFT_236124 [Mycena olivaceomarginata]|nr:hypothetical protein B0H14DRAFT_236124 [Mycena olivaceomarginata]
MPDAFLRSSSLSQLCLLADTRFLCALRHKLTFYRPSIMNCHLEDHQRQQWLHREMVTLYFTPIGLKNAVVGPRSILVPPFHRSPRMLTVPRIPTALATVVIETFFYGIYVILFVASVYLLFTAQARGLRPPRSVWLSPILSGGSLLFITTTGHWICTVDRLFLAFADVDGGLDPIKFYGDFSQRSQIVQSIFLMVSLAIVDVLVVHRLWTVWSHINRYVMIFPALTLVGLCVSTVGVANDFAQFKPGDSVLELANGWIIAATAFTLFTNMYCTGFISWKLWKIQSAVKPAGGRSFRSIVAIIVESAALSTYAVLPKYRISVPFVKTFTEPGQYFSSSRTYPDPTSGFLIDVTPAIVGAANMLIYVRVGLGWAHAPAPPRMAPMRFKVPRFNTLIGAKKTSRPWNLYDDFRLTLRQLCITSAV